MQQLWLPRCAVHVHFMCVCVVCVRVCVCVNVCVNVCVRVYACVCLCIGVCMYICMYKHRHMNVLCICMYVAVFYVHMMHVHYFVVILKQHCRPKYLPWHIAFGVSAGHFSTTLASTATTSMMSTVV